MVVMSENKSRKLNGRTRVDFRRTSKVMRRDQLLSDLATTFRVGVRRTPWALFHHLAQRRKQSVVLIPTVVPACH
jgi:hypothetical protein